MQPELVIEIGNRALEITLVLILILLIPALIVGLAISMFQAATQINEMTLSFIPKLIVTLVVVIMAGPFMLRLMSEYTIRLFNSIPTIVG